MEPIDSVLVHRLRRLAQEGGMVSELLREVTKQLSLTDFYPLLLAKYLREAFGLSLHEVKPIGGWSPAGDGELSDTQLDELMMPNLIAKRAFPG